MKNNYFYLRKDCDNEGRESISKYEYSFNDTIETFLKELVKMHPSEEIIDLHLQGTNVQSEESLKEYFLMKFGVLEILEYYDSDGNKLENYNSNCSCVKVIRPPVIHDMISRFLDYQRGIYFDENDSFADVSNSNLINELMAWYGRAKVSVIKLYSHADILNFKYRCGDNVDMHISKYEKAEIIRDLFSHITLTRVENVKVYELYNVLDLFSSLNTIHSSDVVSEIKGIIKYSEKNNGYLKAIGFNPEYVDNREMSCIVVSNIHGLLANKNLFNGKITHISKFYNNDNDPTKDDVYYEEKSITVNTEFFCEAEAEEIYTYRENYYLLDGSRPFLNMTVQEIEAYLEKNK